MCSARLLSARSCKRKTIETQPTIKVVLCRAPRRPWGSRQPAAHTRLHNVVRDEPGPSSLVGGSKTPAIISMEELMELEIVPEVGVSVELGVAAVEGALTLFVAGEDMNETVLDLFGAGSELRVKVSFLVRVSMKERAREPIARSCSLPSPSGTQRGATRRSIGGIAGEIRRGGS